MGAFYGSVHIRAADASTVIPHVEHVAKSKGGRFLVAPSIGGWVAVYPRDGGQDQRIGAALADRIGGDVIWVSLHDDDVFAYTVWKEGKLLDEYSSCPDYFRRISPAERKRTAGNPSSYIALLPAGITADAVKRDLSGDDTTQLETFARHLRLSNVLTSYDYLMAGETDDVPEFGRFVHVPDRAAELASRRRKQASVADDLGQLRASGLLLFDVAIGEPKRFAPMPTMTSGVHAGEFLYALADHGVRESESHVFRLAPPYTAGPAPTKIRSKSTVHQLCVSPSGKYLAIGHAAGNWFTELWALDTKSLLQTIPQSRAVDFVGFSADETELLSLSEGTLAIVNLADGTLRQMTFNRGSRAVCLHPTENIVVANDGGGGIILLDAQSGGILRGLVATVPSKKDQEAGLDAMLATMRERGLPPEQIELYERQSRGTFALGFPMGVNHTVSRMRFTRDGRRLLYAGSYSLRIYEWESIRSATDSMPMPAFEIPAEPFEHESRRGRTVVSIGPIYDVIQAPSRGLVLFSESAGVIRTVNMVTGNVTELVRPPAQGPIVRLHLSPDEKSIGFGYRPSYQDAVDPTPYRIQIWDLEKALQQPHKSGAF